MVFGPHLVLHSAGEPRRGIKMGIIPASVSLPEGYLDSFFPGSRIDPIRKLWVFKWKSRSYLHSLAFYQHHRIHGTGTYIYLRENHKFGPNVGSKYTVRPMESADVLMCWSSWSSWFSSPGFEFTQSLSKGNKLVFEVSTPSEKYAEVKMGSSSPIFGMSIP